MGISPFASPNVPKAFIQAKPTPTSIKLAGVYINLRELSRHLGCDHGHLSRVFNSKRGPSMRMAARIALTLNMTIDEFVTAIAVRRDRTRLR